MVAGRFADEDSEGEIRTESSSTLSFLQIPQNFTPAFPSHPTGNEQ